MEERGIRRAQHDISENLAFDFLSSSPFVLYQSCDTLTITRIGG